jgi:uncharacterized protein YggE
MDTKIKNYAGASIILSLALFAIASFWYVASFSKSVTSDRSFTVSGEGKVVAVPDVAELSFGVLTEGGKNLADLQKENANKTNAIIAFLKESGIDEKDIKTQSYTVTPRYKSYYCPPPTGAGYSTSCPPAEIVGYSVSQSVAVKIRDVNKAGDIVGGVVEKGANTVLGPTFTVDDSTLLENQARKEAIFRAKEKAKAIAGAGGFRLGKILSLQEGIYFPSPISQPFLGKGGYGGESAGIDIEPGSQEIRVNVTIIYEIR